MAVTDTIIKKLLIVITRTYEQQGSDDDEFVHEWGGAEKRDFIDPDKNTESEADCVLVIHGCKETTDRKDGYNKIITDALKESSLSLSPKESEILIYHHGLNETEGYKHHKKSFETLFKGHLLKIDDYGGGGELASVLGIYNLLKQNNEDNFAEKVFEIAKGNAFFLYLLHHFQQCLLGLHLAFSILTDGLKNTQVENLFFQYRVKLDDVCQVEQLKKYLYKLKDANGVDKALGLETEDVDRFFMWEMDDISSDDPKSLQSGIIKALLFGTDKEVRDAWSSLDKQKDKELLQKELQSQIRLHSQSLDRIIFAVNSRRCAANKDSKNYQ